MKLIWASVILIFVFSCQKSRQGYIPDVPVSFRTPLSDPRLSRLNSGGGAVAIDGYGVCGLLLYRRPDGVYAAYDRCSSYQPEKKCTIKIDDPSLTATDPCSGSKFSLFDGSPVKAPATRLLKIYQVNVSNNEIFVYN
ncbi:MAG: Rieske (2Fe-2S) protein [Sphingobacteriaceae bacterium]